MVCLGSHKSSQLIRAPRSPSKGALEGAGGGPRRGLAPRQRVFRTFQPMHAADPRLLPFPSHPAGWMAGEALQEGPPLGSGPWECGGLIGGKGKCPPFSPQREQSQCPHSTPPPPQHSPLSQNLWLPGGCWNSTQRWGLPPSHQLSPQAWREAEVTLLRP